MIQWQEKSGPAAEVGAHGAKGMLEEQIFFIQSRVVIGGLFFFSSAQKTYGWTDEQVEKMRGEIRDVFLASTFGPLAEETVSDSDKRAVHQQILKFSERQLRAELVLASYLKFKPGVELLAAELNSRVKTEVAPSAATASLLNLLDGKTLPTDEFDVLAEDLSWFFELLLSERASSETARAEHRKKVIESTEPFFTRFVALLAGGILIALLSLVLAGVFAYLLVGGKLNFRFTPSGEPREYCLEIFALYLLVMTLGFSVLRAVGSSFSVTQMFIANVLFILSTLLVVFWPRLNGVRFSVVRQDLGLGVRSAREFVSDIFLAPATYLAAWTPLFFILIIYSLVISLLGIDITRGSHPIVPFLLHSEDPKVIYLIVFLAVVVAPIVEETMFRGALYSWLRERMRASFAIVLCGLIFAFVHPQGALGVLPLTCLAIVFGFLREWRGSLLAPMIAHACFNGGTLVLLLYLFR